MEKFRNLFIGKYRHCVVPRSFASFVLNIRELSFNPAKKASMNKVAGLCLK